MEERKGDGDNVSVWEPEERQLTVRIPTIAPLGRWPAFLARSAPSPLSHGCFARKPLTIRYGSLGRASGGLCALAVTCALMQ